MRANDFTTESAVEELKNKLPSLKNTSYDTIDELMQKISRRYKLTGKKLHDLFVHKYGHTPDTWIKKIKNRLSEYSDEVVEGEFQDEYPEYGGKNPNKTMFYDRNVGDYKGEPWSDAADNWSGDKPNYADSTYEPEMVTLQGSDGKMKEFPPDSPEVKGARERKYGIQSKVDQITKAFTQAANTNAIRPNLATSDSTNDFTDPVKLGQYDVDFPEQNVVDPQTGSMKTIPSPNDPNVQSKKPPEASSKFNPAKFGISTSAVPDADSLGSREKIEPSSKPNPDQKQPVVPISPKAPSSSSSSTPSTAKPKPGSWQELAQLNKITDPTKLQAGTRINTPDGGSIYVNKGDTLSGIAQSLRTTGMPPSQINLKPSLQQISGSQGQKDTNGTGLNPAITNTPTNTPPNKSPNISANIMNRVANTVKSTITPTPPANTSNKQNTATIPQGGSGQGVFPNDPRIIGAKPATTTSASAPEEVVLSPSRQAEVDRVIQARDKFNKALKGSAGNIQSIPAKNPPKTLATTNENATHYLVKELEMFLESNILNDDWQKVNKKDKTDGMSKKAVKAYRRENPGSKLKTAVTTKPSKLKKGSKSAKRRKSFCARMSGMKKAHASAKTKRDPDSPINKALRRWNCESIEQMQELIMIAEQKVVEAKNLKQQAAIAIAKKNKVSESVDSPDEVQQIKDFIKWSMKTLNVKTKPKFTLSKNTDQAQAGHHTGVHSGDRIWIYIGNRNLIDIFRTIFHELVHQRQQELNMIKDGDSYPGSPIEAMADMMAGKYIKIYGKEHPEIFQ